MYVDVHTHLTHEKFRADQAQVIARAKAAGLGAVVVNGLEPRSNREILELATDPLIKAALGIYPIDAVNDRLPADFPFPVARFDVKAEVQFIREQAKAGKLVAVGECGLDGHWLGESTFKAQEAVFEQLIGVAMEADLPVIIHTRKLEQRAIEMLAALGAKKVDFHCFGGKVKLAVAAAEKHGWYFSIPANAPVNEAFQKMLKDLPVELILTETDAPYLSPVKGARNEPANVVGTVRLFGEIRGMTETEAKNRIWTNYQTLFGAA